MSTATTSNYVPEIQVEFEKIEFEKHETESISSSTDSDEEKTRNIKLLPRAHLLRLDSGSSIGEEEDPAEITEELREKIVTQAEYYFSDENLKKDGFLLKHVKRNKEGYVNLKLLASFKKMRSLSRDYRVIGEALKDSKQLVVNETGLKLRRVTPLPKELLDQVRVKHIVLTNIPHENPSMNFVTEAFENHKDDVVSVRIIKPGKKFPNDLQSHFSRHPELRDEIVAVVEFENPDVANEAIKTTFSNKYNGLSAKLLELGPKQAKRIGSAGNSDASGANDSDASIDRNRNSQKGKRNSRLLEVSGAEDYPSSASDTEFSAFSSCNRRYNRSRGNSPSTSPKQNRRQFSDTNNNSKNNSRNNSRNPSPSVSPKTSPKNPRKNNSNNNNNNNNGSNNYKGSERKQSNNSHKLSPLVNGVQRNSPNSSPEFERRSKSRGNSFNEEKRTKSRGNSFNEDVKESTETKLSPWMQRKLLLSQNLKNNANSPLNGGLPQLEIIRQPKGPDGSVGFSNHPLKKYVLVHAY